MTTLSGKAVMGLGMICAAGQLFAQGRDPDLTDSGDSDLGAQYVQEKGLYFGAELGLGKSEQDISDFNNSLNSLVQQGGFQLAGGSSEFDDSDTAFSLKAGYNFNENFGAEISYVNFGTVEYRALAQVQQVGNNTLMNVTSSADIETQGLALSAVGRLPVSEAFAVRTRLGLILTKSDVDFRTSVPSTAASNSLRTSRSESTSDTNLLVSVGAMYSFENRWTVTLDYEILKRTGDDRFLDDIGAVTPERVNDIETHLFTSLVSNWE